MLSWCYMITLRGLKSAAPGLAAVPTHTCTTRTHSMTCCGHIARSRIAPDRINIKTGTFYQLELLSFLTLN